LYKRIASAACPLPAVGIAYRHARLRGIVFALAVETPEYVSAILDRDQPSQTAQLHIEIGLCEHGKASLCSASKELTTHRAGARGKTPRSAAAIYSWVDLSIRCAD
jgi:hypothetical protein